MLNANGHKNYTATGNVKAEKLLERVLTEIGSALKSSGLSIYLGGSYGRGEGGVRQDAENGILYNDLDFFAFSRTTVPDAAKLLETVAEKYEAELNVDVDFSRVMGVKDIKRNRCRLMMQELKRGYRLVCGEDLLAEYLPEIPADALPFSEACRLLLNRGMGLLFAREKLSNASSDTDFILRNIYKAILGSGDAMLIADGQYGWKIADRRQMIQDSKLNESCKKLYAQAVDFKFSPSRNIAVDLPELLEKAQRFFDAALLDITGTDDPGSFRQALYWQCRKHNEVSLFNYIKYCIKTRKLHGDIKFASMPPATVVLSGLYGKREYSDLMYKHWQLFN